MSFLTRNNLVTPQQHGFVRGRSCQKNILLCLEKWMESMDVNNNNNNKAFTTTNQKRNNINNNEKAKTTTTITTNQKRINNYNKKTKAQQKQKTTTTTYKMGNNINNINNNNISLVSVCITFPTRVWVGAKSIWRWRKSVGIRFRNSKRRQRLSEGPRSSAAPPKTRTLTRKYVCPCRRPSVRPCSDSASTADLTG